MTVLLAASLLAGESSRIDAEPRPANGTTTERRVPAELHPELSSSLYRLGDPIPVRCRRHGGSSPLVRRGARGGSPLAQAVLLTPTGRELGRVVPARGPGSGEAFRGLDRVRRGAPGGQEVEEAPLGHLGPIVRRPGIYAVRCVWTAEGAATRESASEPLTFEVLPALDAVPPPSDHGAGR